MAFPLLAVAGLAFKVLPFAKGLLGEGLVGQFLEHRRKQAESASEMEKARLEADVRMAEHELKRRAMIRDLQIREYEHPWLWWGRFALLFSVGLYWAARFQVKTWGLNDFGVAIAELSTTEATVSGMVLTYWFLGDKIERAMSGKKNPG